MIGAGALTGLVLASQFSHQRAIAQVPFSSYPFTLGVASGEPYPTSIVLWTRLAPDSLNGGGMPQVNVPIRWEVATDPYLKHIVAKGTEIAIPELAHSVRVVVEGLKPNTWYWYRFTSGGEASPIGRTRTAPKPGRDVSKFAFAFVSCQHYEQGYYTAYKYLAEDDLDLVVHLGDYIYEGGITSGRVRQHNSPEIVTLEDYRNRHALSNPESSIVGSEFVCTSISSGGDGSDSNSTVAAYLPDNPHIKFYNGQRGYVRCVLSPTNWQTDYLVMSAVTTESGTISNRASFVIENGRLGIQQV
ncbi:PhoD-like phosphatase N-terminal domain-containing protein [Fischerella sp. FACHB-380]|nr:alkaline phosphatase D family protein [Fischerella sp. FACHB-380]MBD2434968.1 PhoD-like phosphatase N-terminal domain-containing protein [Fischerella sp. FACHB-380]